MFTLNIIFVICIISLIQMNMSSILYTKNYIRQVL